MKDIIITIDGKTRRRKTMSEHLKIIKRRKTVLFRGKQSDPDQWEYDGEGEWVYGDLWRDDKGITDASYKMDWIIHNSEYDDTKVDPDTVGEYTELDDANGTAIFDGDIIKSVDSELRLTRYWKVVYGSREGNDEPRWYLIAIDGKLPYETLLYIPPQFPHTRIKVVGNIFDNKDFKVPSGKEGERNNEITEVEIAEFSGDCGA